MMRLFRIFRFWTLFILGFACWFFNYDLLAQTTNVTVTVTGPGPQTWSNGTFSYIFQNAPNYSGQSQWQGANMPSQYLTQTTVALDGTGSAAFTIPDNSTITPALSTWRFTACPLATTQCITVQMPVSGASQNISSTINAALNPINVTGAVVPIAYQDSQVTTAVRAGSIYYNSTLGNPRFFNGSIWQNFGSGSGGGVPVVAGSAQYANNNASLFFSGGVFNTDVFTSGLGNNGIQNFFNSSACTAGGGCFAMVPPTSTDNEIFNAFFNPAAGKFSTLGIDQRGNTFGFRSLNPGVGFNQIFDGNGIGPRQVLFPNLLGFTEPSPSPLEGASQGEELDEVVFGAPGFSNGTAACSSSAGFWFCPTAPHTSVGSWAGFPGFQHNLNWNSAGIRNASNWIDNCYGIGDCQPGAIGANFTKCAGGATAGSDEGCHHLGSIHELSVPDSGGSITTIIDNNHIVVNMTDNPTQQGQGRYLYDNTPITDQSSLLLQDVPVSLIRAPGDTFPYGTIVFNSANFAVDGAEGTLTQDCTVTTQEGGLATGTNGRNASGPGTPGCQVTLTKGQFCATGLWNGTSCQGSAPVQICAAFHLGGFNDIGMIPSAAANPSGGTQVVTWNMHRTVPSGGYVFQGPMCGVVGTQKGDQQTNTEAGGAVTGGTFVVIGAVDAHTLVYMMYNGSEVWQAIPALGSQWGSRDTGNTVAAKGFLVTNMSRVSNVVTGVTSTGFQSTPPRYQMLNHALFFNVSNCTDTSFQTIANQSLIEMYGPFPNPSNSQASIQYIQSPGTFPDASGVTCTIGMLNTAATLFPAAEIYDVMNHATGVVDGTFALSYQPLFHTGDIVFTTVHPVAATNTLSVVKEEAQPLTANTGVVVSNIANSSFVGTDYESINTPTSFQIWGNGGAGYPKGGYGLSGLYSNWIYGDTAPVNGGCLICSGVASGLFNGNIPDFRNYGVFQLEKDPGGTYLTGLNFDQDSETYQWIFDSLKFNPHYTFGPNLVNFANLHGTNTYVPVRVGRLDFGGFNANPAIPFFSIKQCTSLTPLSPAIDCYQAAVTNTAVPFTTGTAGTTTYIYIIQINDVMGPTYTSTYFLNTGNATLSTTNYNNIPCSDVPTGKTGTVYLFHNPVYMPVGPCTSPSTVVLDQGSYGANILTNGTVAGVPFIAGGFIGTGGTGSIGFNNTNPHIDDANILYTAFSEPNNGEMSCDTGTRGNGQCILDAGSVIVKGNGFPILSGTTTNSNLDGRLTFAGVTTATFTFIATTPAITTSPVCVPSPEFDIGSGNRLWVTYTGVTSFTINAATAITGTVGYHCMGFN